MTIEQIFFELIRVAIGTQVSLSRKLSLEEWKTLYEMAKKQSLVGICFAAVQRLPEDMRPSEMLYLTWMGMAAKIQQRNEVVNRQCVELQSKLCAGGFLSCVLKGQGVGTLYRVYDPSTSLRNHNDTLRYDNLSMLRQSGDIDIWIPSAYQKTIEYLKENGVAGKITANHAEAHFFEETEVEVHPIPAMFRNPLTNKKWKKFCKEHENNWAEVNVGSTSSLCGFKTPSVEFNLVFLMVHMYQHLLREGIGLRQMMDYYWILSNSPLKGEDKKNLMKVISSLGMKRFAGGVMCIMESTFGMPHDLLLCEPDPETGAELLSEIMTGGNFGHYDERNAAAFDNSSNPIVRVWRSQKRNLRFLKYGFWEIAWSPFWRLWHFCWMKINGYR